MKCSVEIFAAISGGILVSLMGAPMITDKEHMCHRRIRSLGFVTSKD
jgi:hypothetical protein